MIEHETRTTFFLKVSLSIFVFLVCLIFTTCGLETFYYLDPPIDGGHTTRYDTEGAQAYFSFITNETGSNGMLGGDFNFQGTEVYYSIFSNSSTMESVQDSIDSLNTKSDVSAAAESMIKTYGYQNLLYCPSGTSKTRTSTPFIPYSGENRSVYIRLNTPQGSSGVDEMKPAICYSDNYDGNSIGTPRRKTGSNNYGFEFTSNGSGKSDNPSPKSGDSDLYSSSSSDASIWYVDMWAVSVGRDASYSPSYSRLLHLGSVKIEEGWYNN